MRLRLLLTIVTFLLFIQFNNAQTFNGFGGVIPDSGAVYGIFPLQVSNIGNINNQFGLAEVCVNINHSWDADLEIYLESPDGTIIPLSIQNGGSGQNYTGTCFSATTTTPLENGNAPFAGSFIPDGYMGAVNNGQSANGTWNLIIKDIASGETGNLINWSIRFSNSLPPAPPACNGNNLPANDCTNATPICSFSGFCAATSSQFTADTWPGLNQAFCGTVQNNAFVKFVATATNMLFYVWVTSSVNHDGIQMLFFEGNCGNGTVTEFGCFSPIRPGSSPNIISAVGLTPGNTYYLMIDGFAGDECNYIMDMYPQQGALNISASDNEICLGNSVQLQASGGNGNYTWTGPGLTTNSGNSVIANPPYSANYTVSSIDPGGLCPITKQMHIEVMDLPSPPTVTDTLKYCMNDIARPLTAAGSNITWYNQPNGGIGSQQSIVPSTIIPGFTTYYVSQTIGCESERASITVKVNALPSAGNDKQKAVCFGNTANLVNMFDTSGLLCAWTFNGTPVSPPIQASASGNYQLQITDENGCSGSATVHFTVKPPLHIDIQKDTFALKGIPFQLHCNTPGSTYSWAPATLLSAADIRNPFATITKDQLFTLEVRDETGCKGEDSVLIKIYSGNTYYIPNAFTPNNDGINDIFRAVPIGIHHTILFRIINRYGKTLFETADPYNKGWDGSFMGMPQSPGTYIWFIKGIDKNDKPVEMKGTVILIR